MYVKFPTFKGALDFILAQEADRALHTLTVTDMSDRQLETMVIEDLPGEITAELASTLAEFAVNPQLVACSAVGSEAHYGYILSHYEHDGTPVRFYAII